MTLFNLPSWLRRTPALTVTVNGPVPDASGRTPKVIDIYHGNTVNDFAKLKAFGVVGVIHKCTQGAYVDPAYATRRKQALAAGLLWGAYTFNTGDDTLGQVKNFLSHAEPDKNTLLALDFEDNPNSQMNLAKLSAFLQTFEERQGRKAVLYSGNRIKDLLGDYEDIYLGSHKLWLAEYGPAPRLQASWKHYWLWQYSENGKLPGTDGFIDLDHYDGTPEQLAAEWAQ